MPVKTLIRRVVDEMSEHEALRLLDFLNLQADPDTLNAEEQKLVKEGIRAIESGDYVSLEEIRAERARE